MTNTTETLNALKTAVAATKLAADTVGRWDATNGIPNTPAELAMAFFQFKELYVELDKQRKAIYAIKDLIEKHLMPTALEAQGLDMIRVPELARSFSIRAMMSAGMLDKEAGIEWLRANEMGDLVQETVNAGTLSSAFRTMMLEKGIDPPDDLFKITHYKTTGINKYTPK